MENAKFVRPGAVPEAVSLSAEKTTYLKGTETAGLYTLQGLPGGDATYAFNLSSRGESDNGALSALDVGDTQITALKAAIESKREIWPHLAWIALVVLLLEWWVFHRRIGL